VNTAPRFARIKFAAAIKSGAGFPPEEQDLKDEELPFYKVASLEEADSGGILNNAEHTISQATASRLGAHVFGPGTVVFAKVGAALLLNRFRQLGSASCLDNNMMGLEALAGVAHPRYLLHAMSAKDLSVIVNPGAVPSVNGSQIAEERVWLPGLNDQERIANFLDEQTARIDALIAEKEKLVTALSELHRATLWQLVTKGCTGNNTIDSGVEWIGEVPEHWTVRAIKWITPVLRGASPRPIDDPKYFDEDGQYGWVRIADVSASDGLLTSTEQRLSELGDSLSVKQEPGDLFLSIAGTVGKPCIAGIKCCIHDGFVWFPSIGHDALRDWLFAIFESGFAYAGLGKMGTQLNLNTDTVGSIRVPIPPLDEMRRILDRAREERAANLALKSHVQKHVSLLREYRSSLISAAVTGQLSIDEFQARQLEVA
jgi:type I restriction enzyme S subunit